MIETKQALDNLEDIVSVKGLDAVYIGPSDLSLALGCTPTFDDVDPPVTEAIDRILASAKKHGIAAGIHNGTPEAALKRIRKRLPIRNGKFGRAVDGSRRPASHQANGESRGQADIRRRQPSTELIL
jgi:hypothetical protein